MSDHAPLSAAVFHVLLSLAGGPRHGYGIIQEVAAQTGGAFRLGPGTLYGTLQRLVELGWVEECGSPGRQLVDSRRRYYRLVRAGRLVLDAEVHRLEGLIRTARSRGIGPRTARS